MPETMPELKIHLFGAFEVLCADQPIQHKYWQSRQVRTIFKLLVIQRGHPLTSTQIIEVLWPKEKPEVALKRLYIRISQLRRILEELKLAVNIQTVTGGYLFACMGLQKSETSVCWIDVDVFEKLADQGRSLLEQNRVQEAIAVFENAKRLYRSDYLVEDQYDDWSMGERERLRDRYLVLLTELSEAYAQMGQYRRAINACHKVLQADSCREAVFVRLMLFYYYAGEKTNALQTFELCQQTLWKELGVEPDTSTVDLAAKIQNGSLWQQPSSPQYPPPNYEGRMYEVPFSLGDLPLVGRDREYAWLVNTWDKHPGSVILVDGEAGVGKSRLVETFAGYIKSRETNVFLTKGIAGLKAPYSLFLQMKQENSGDGSQLSRNLASLLEKEIERAERGISVLDHLHMADLVKGFLKGDSARTVLMVDDAQWADEPSRNLLLELAGTITIVLAFRSGEGCFNSLFGEGKTETPLFRLTLPRLSSTHVKTLIGRLSDAELPEFQSFVFKKTGGNPLFILVFLQNLFESGNLFVNHQGKWVWLADEEVDPPRDLLTMIETRLRGLRLEERRVLDVLAAAGGAIDIDLLQAVLEIREMSLIPLIDTLIERSYLVEPRARNEAELALVHGLYTEVIYQTLPNSRKRIYHRRLAAGLVNMGRDKLENAALVAHHAELGQDHELAAAAYHEAGWYALKLYVPQQAEHYFSRALALTEELPEPKNDDLLGKILFGQAECQRLSGDYEQAMTGYAHCVSLLPALLKQAAVYQAFQLNVMMGAEQQNFEELTKKLEAELLIEGESWALALLHWGQAFSKLIKGEIRAVIRHNRDGWRTARNLLAQGDVFPPWIWQRAYTLLARMHIQWGNLLTARKVVDCLIHHAQETEQQNNLAAAQAWRGEVYLGLSQYKAAQEAFLVSLEIAEKANDPRLIGEASLGLGRAAYEKGDFRAAAAYAEQVWKIGEENKDVLRQLNAMLLKAKIGLKTNQTIDSLPGLLNLLMLANYLDAKPYVVPLLTVLLEIYIKMGEEQKAVECLEEALRLAQECGLKAYNAILKRQQAVLEGNPLYLNQALHISREIGCLFETAQILRTQADLSQDLNTKRKLYKAAWEIFNDIGAAFEKEEMMALLADAAQETDPFS